MKITDNKIGKYKLKARRATLGSGIGLFAEEDIPKGEYVIEYFGRELSEAEQYTSKSQYLFEITKKITVDGNIPDNLARYINHSCRPNCKAEIKKKRILINSIKNIKAGEQLSYDYGKEFWNEHIKPKGCKCNKCYKPEDVLSPIN